MAPIDRLVPSGAQRCIWMSAGLVAYKLCDRDYDCDHCPLDEALRGCAPPRKGRGAPPQDPLLHPGFPADRRYGRGHLWARGVAPDTVRLGVDGFAATLLGRALSLIVPPAGSPVRRGHPICWWVDEIGPVPLMAPISGTAIGGNLRALGDPVLAFEEPYGDGWLLEVQCEELERQIEDLLDVAAIRRAAVEDLRRLGRDAAAQSRRRRSRVGPTLPDGGLPAQGLRATLGAARYHRLLVRLLG